MPSEDAINPTTQSSAASNQAWETVRCALCGGCRTRNILRIPHPEAPGGQSALVECTDCGLRRLDPRPGPAVVGRYYEQAGASSYNAYVGRRRSPRTQAIWNFLRDGYARPPGQSLPARLASPLTGGIAHWAFDINVALNRQRGLRVLEVGAGYGDILIYLASRGCQVLGTDLSPAAVSKAAEYGVEVRLGHLVDLHLPSGSFDVALMCHSLEHVPDPNVELAELHRVLVPGGRVHIAVPNGNAVRLDHDGLAFAHLSFPLHNWFFGPDTLERMLVKHGFRSLRHPWTTTRHHALMEWLGGMRLLKIPSSTRRFARFLATSCNREGGGDVLRTIAVSTPPAGHFA